MDTVTEARCGCARAREHRRRGSQEAAKIAALIAESDQLFRGQVIPAIAAGRRDRIPEIHTMTEHAVEEVVALNEALNRIALRNFVSVP